VFGLVDGEFEEGVVEQSLTIRLIGAEGCGDSNAEVEFNVESVRTFIGRTFTAEDGSYRAEIDLPAAILPGDHMVFAAIEGRAGEEDAPLEVLGADVLGEDEDNDGGGSGNQGQASGGGVLPRTGAGILLLILWAIVLIGGGTLLARAAWKYRMRFAPVAAMHRRNQQREMDSIQGPDLPVLDTSRFVPQRTQAPPRRSERFNEIGRFGSHTEPPEPENLSEWDLVPPDDFQHPQS
jgi:hypothetical protein